MVASGGGAASELAEEPESAPASIGALALSGVDASADRMGDGLPAAPLDDAPLPPRDEPDEPDELGEPPAGALAGAPELLAPVSPCEPAGGAADSLFFGESLPHAAMNIAAPKHEISLPETRTIKYSCQRMEHDCVGELREFRIAVALLCVCERDIWITPI